MVMMMKCTDVQKYLDDYLDDEMSLGEQKAVEAHVKLCSSCQQALEAHKAIHQALRSLPVDEASPDFEAKVFAAVRSHYNTHKKHSGNRFVAGFTTAMAASLALWFASTMYTPQFDVDAPQVVNLAMNQARTVKLVFEAPTDLAEVTLSVQLPENIELEGYAGRRQLVWQTNLSKGQNILALPVIAIGAGQGELVAQLNYGDKTKQFYIVLKTTSDGALIYQINTLKSA
jgi:anti-sigma factor RsiW